MVRIELCRCFNGTYEAFDQTQKSVARRSLREFSPPTATPATLPKSLCMICPQANHVSKAVIGSFRTKQSLCQIGSVNFYVVISGGYEIFGFFCGASPTHSIAQEGADALILCSAAQNFARRSPASASVFDFETVQITFDVVGIENLRIKKTVRAQVQVPMHCTHGHHFGKRAFHL